MEFDEVIRKRHCVRNFKTTKKPSYSEILEAIEAASLAPQAGNLPVLKYIIVSDKEKIIELAKAAQQDFIAQAPYIIAICSDMKFLEKSYYERAKMYSRQQAGAAIENFFLKIIELGLATCWVGAFADDVVSRILELPEGIQIEAILPVGYELKKTPLKRKPPIINSVFFEKYGKKMSTPEIVPYDKD